MIDTVQLELDLQNANDNHQPHEPTGPETEEMPGQDQAEPLPEHLVALLNPGRGMSQREVAEVLGISQQAVQQIERRALWKCRQRLLAMLRGPAEDYDEWVLKLKAVLNQG